MHSNPFAGATRAKATAACREAARWLNLPTRVTSRNNRTRANSPSGTIADSDSFTYDKAGRMLTAISGRYTNTVGYAYDDAGRKSSESLTISGKTYTTVTSYNTKGQLTGYTYPDGTSVQRSYTDRGELHQLKHAGTTIDTRTYDNGGRMTGSSYNNGVSESRSYNSDNTLASISYSGASIGNLSYSWDDNKNKTAETISGTMSNYGFSIPTTGYDSEDRLVTFNRTSGLNQSWSLSAVGDWNSLTTNGTSQARTHGPTHELTAVAGNAVSTDVKGNMTLIPSAARPDNTALGLSWDMDNRLKSADVGNNGSAEVTYQFDALGRRVARTASGTTTVYVQSGQQTIADYTAGANSSSPLYRYVYASYIDEPVLRYQPTGAQSVYYHRNQQYSVTALTNSSGAILERYAYTAYGTPTITNGAGTVLTSSAHNNRYTYTGREWDQTISLYHYRARMYDPALGRFCSRDPIAYLSSTWNLFAYAELSPELLIDPSGLWAFPFGPISPGAYLRQQIDAAYAQMRDQMLYAASYASNKTKTLAKKILMWALSLPCPAAALVGGENCENYELRRESSYGVPIFAKDMVKWYWGGKATVCCSCDCRKISLSGKISGRLKSPARLMRGIANLVFSASGSITAKYKVCNGSPATLAGTLSATGAVTARRNVKFGIKNVPFLGPATVEIFGESGYYYTRQYSIPSFGLIRAEAGGFARFVGDMAFGKIHHRVSHSYTNGTLMPDFE